jgi:hypothetical protein
MDKKEYSPFEVPNAITRKKVTQASEQVCLLNRKTARVKNSPCGNDIRIAQNYLQIFFNLR